MKCEPTDSEEEIKNWGPIVDVRVFNRILTKEECDELYDAPIGSKDLSFIDCEITWPLPQEN